MLARKHSEKYSECVQEKSIQSQGGKARKESLTAEQRAGIASQAAKARWAAAKPPGVLHKGNFMDEFGFDVECYVLDDPQKTAVVSQSGMGEALGLSRRGNAFPRFLHSKAMVNSVSAQLRDKLSQPIKFQSKNNGAQGSGFDVTLLIDICRAIIDVEPFLDRQQKHVALQAHVILNASAKAGIKGLVYALAGYNPSAEEVISAFKLYVQEEAKKYEKEFPDELYMQWYRLYQIPVLPRGRPWHFKHLTVKHVYGPLAQSNGKILQLTRALKGASGDRKSKLFQFLSEVGTRALRFHLGRLVEMAEDSEDLAAYERKITKRFGGQQELDFVEVSPAPTSEETCA